MNNIYIERGHSGKSSFSSKTNFTRIAMLRKTLYQLQPLPHLQLDPQLQLPLPQEDIFFQIEGFEYISLGIEFTHAWTSFQV
jgi:hypothetical protein